MHIDSTALPPGAVVAVEVDGQEYVVWRGRSGRLGSGPRVCPHLDHDLAEGYVAAPARKHDEPEGNEAEYDGEGTHEGGVVACQRHHREHTHGGGAGEGER